MSVTMQQVLSEIDKDEPNYAVFAALGPDAVPHLQMIAESADPLKASKAAYAATLIGGPQAITLLRKAADHHDPQVRIAVAHGLRNMTADAPSDMVIKSLNDADAGVRKLALSTAGLLKRADFKERITTMSLSDPADNLRAVAAQIVKP